MNPNESMKFVIREILDDTTIIDMKITYNGYETFGIELTLSHNKKDDL